MHRRGFLRIEFAVAVIGTSLALISPDGSSQADDDTPEAVVANEGQTAPHAPLPITNVKLNVTAQKIAGKKDWTEFVVSGTCHAGTDKRPPGAVVYIKDQGGVIHDSHIVKFVNAGGQKYQLLGVVTVRRHGPFTVQVRSVRKVVATQNVQAE